jgi:hypothetical protein
VEAPAEPVRVLTAQPVTVPDTARLPVRGTIGLDRQHHPARIPGRREVDAVLSGLAGLAQEMYERSHPDGPDDLFDERYPRLGITFRGAGRAEGDLTPQCAAALDAVLEKLGKKAGAEDTRTAAQRRHDALRRGMLIPCCGRAELRPGRLRRARLTARLAWLSITAACRSDVRPGVRRGA